MSGLLARWHNLSKRTQWIAAIGVILLALAGMGALSGQDSTSTAAPIEAQEIETSTPSPPSTPDSTDLVAWSGEVSDWSFEMADAFETLSTLLQDDAFNARLLLGDSEAAVDIAIPLVTMQQCSATWPNAPPNRRAQAIERIILRACDSFERSAALFTTGVDNQNVSKITAAADELVQGTQLLTDATAMTKDLAVTS